MPQSTIRLFVVLILIFGASRSMAESWLPLGPGGKLVMTPEPAWAIPTELDASPVADDGDKSVLAGLAFRLLDQHYSFSNSGSRKYERMVIEIGSPAVREQFSVFTLALHEGNQTAAMHAFRVWREGHAIDLSGKAVTELQKSAAGLSSGYATDQTSLQIMVPDLRVGDLLDIAYSTEGVQPGLEHQRNEAILLARLAPVRRLIARATSDSDTPLHVHAVGGAEVPEAQRRDSRIEYLWDLRDVPPITFENNAPSWHYQIPSVALTAADDWGDIAAWARPLFTFDPGSVDAAVVEKARALTHGLVDETKKFEAIIAFVQGEIRYLGPGLSRNGFRPFSPEDVLGRGWGDCKDKSMLALTMLDAVGIEARAALTNIGTGYINPDIPTVSAFDHVIVLADIDGETRWIDTTSSTRSPTQPSYSLAKTNFALPISDRGGALVALDLERLTVAGHPDIDFSVFLDLQRGMAGTISLGLAGSRADTMRQVLESYGGQSIAEVLLTSASDIGDNVTLDGDLRISDNYKENILNISHDISARYFWKKVKDYDGYQFYSRPNRMKSYLPSKIDGKERKAPYRIDYPLTIRETHSLSLHKNIIDNLETDTRRIERGSYEFLQTQTIEGTRLIIETTFKTLLDHIPLQELALYGEDYDKMKKWYYYIWTERNNPFKDADTTPEIDQAGMQVPAPELNVPGYVIPSEHIVDKTAEDSEAGEDGDKPSPPAPENP